MKTFNRIILIASVCMNCLIVANAQHSGTLSTAKRDSLIALSKEVILKFGPDYYREYKQPEIEYKQYPSADKIGDKRYIHWADRYYYRVTFPYDKTQETLEMFYAAKVDIWADTFEPSGVMFGCGMGINISAFDDWRNNTTMPIIEYEDATVPIFPILSVLYPDSLIGKPEEIQEYFKWKEAELRSQQEPRNKEELIKRGWERRSNGEWVKTRRDVPPHRRNR